MDADPADQWAGLGVLFIAAAGVFVFAPELLATILICGPIAWAQFFSHWETTP